MKRNKHKVLVKFTNVPKAPREVILDQEGKAVPFMGRKVDHVVGNAVYHPTKGWRKIRQYHTHLLLVNLFEKLKLKEESK